MKFSMHFVVDCRLSSACACNTSSISRFVVSSLPTGVEERDGDVDGTGERGIGAESPALNGYGVFSGNG